MSSFPSTLESASPESLGRAATTSGTLLVCLPSSTLEGLRRVRGILSSLHPGARLLFAVPEQEASSGAEEALIPLPVPPRSRAGWVLIAGDYAAATQLAQEHGATATLIIGSDTEALTETALNALSSAALSATADIIFPRFNVDPHEGLVSAALLYPLSHTLFASPVHLPLPLDCAFTSRAVAQLGAAARRHMAGGAGNALLWPASEAFMANLRVAEIAAGPHTLTAPSDTDLNDLLGEVIGSAFSDIEAKAVFWQRARLPNTPANGSGVQQAAPAAQNTNLDDIAPMVDSFRNAYNNLQQIWALVLPPHSLLALKKLSLTPAESFRMPPSLWARSVYEFILAFHLRTLNRGHLLGALTPLYLAWVASYLGQVGDNPELAATVIEQTAATFEAEKPYLVSRWRWPDRFNP